MTKKKKGKSDEKSKSVNEPLAIYGTNRIQFFKSFDEMAEADAKEMAKATPLEHLQNVTAYIMHTYSNELKNKMTDLTIHFK